jgi:hypothetical protein
MQAAMNWQPHAWNDRKWTVAQGDGLWKHIDYTKARKSQSTAAC